MGTDDNFISKLPNLLINSLPFLISRSRSLLVNCHDDFCRDHRNYHRSFIYHREDRRSEETRRKEDFSFFAFISFFSVHEVRWIHFSPGDSTAEGETTHASGMETEGDEVEADEVKDLTEDAKEVGKAEKPRQAKK